MGIGASATVTKSGGILGATTSANNGSGYNTLPIVAITRGGSPSVITGYTALVTDGASGFKNNQRNHRFNR